MTPASQHPPATTPNAAALPLHAHLQGVIGERVARGTDMRCFTIASEGRLFGLPVEHIQTVFEIVSVTAVPLAPPEVLGLVNLRGKIVTAVSLRRRLRGGRESEPSSLAVGLDYRGESFALVVDEVGDVVSLDAESRIDNPPHLGAERVKISSVHRLADAILPILDVDWIFTFGTDRP